MGASSLAVKLRYFPTPRAFREWLERSHLKVEELWVGFYKKGTGRPSITWPESVDEALSFGWIDGLRRSVDDESYCIRFTPRKSSSIWSAVNIRRVRALIAEGRMRPAGLKAFEARKENRSGVYSFEQRPRSLDPPYERMFRKNERAWAFFQSQPPWYRRTSIWWVVSAKKEETRLKRLSTLIDDSARERTIAPLTRKVAKKK
jgi:uncharacterized protein YdeI (YjbR/CyaY-like superfamily)